MKDIKQVSLNSIVFYVEEDGYIALKKYINNLERYYADKEGGKEIIEDIQIRFAELLSEKRTFAEQAITMQDIESVIAVLGYPDNFEPEENRDFRQQEIPHHKKRKPLYRDLEDAKIAGICSGLSYYFDVDAWVFRLIFIVLTLFSGGLWILIYFILWFVLPQAKTTQQRYDMKGEALNIEDIEQRFKNVVNEAEDRIRDLTNKKKVKDFANKSADNLRDTASGISSGAAIFFRFLGKVVGFFFVITSVCAIAAILLLWFFPTPSFFSVEKEYSMFYLREIFTVLGLNNIAFCLFLTCVLLPFIFILFSGIALLTRKLRKVMGIILSALFVLWIVLLIFVGIGTFTFIGGKTFSHSDVPETIEIPVSSQNIIIKSLPSISFPKEEIRIFNKKFFIYRENNQTRIYGVPRLKHYNVSYTNDSIVSLRVYKNFSNEVVEFQNLIKVQDSIIYIPSLFHLKKNHWSGEEIMMELSVPRGVQLTIEEPFAGRKKVYNN